MGNPERADLISRTFAVGPYVGFSGGAHSSSTAGSSGGTMSIPSDSRTFHGWVQFGVKGTANP